MYRLSLERLFLTVHFSLCLVFNPLQAMCCSDHIHCCPSDTICDLEHGVCKSGETQLPLLKKIAAVTNDGKQLTDTKCLQR